jgi:DNA-binding IscR family transcriptional regulator
VLHAVRGPLEEMFGFDPPPAGADDVPAAVWTDVRAQLVGVLEHATLQDFVARAEASGVKRAELPATMYFI